MKKFIFFIFFSSISAGAYSVIDTLFLLRRGLEFSEIALLAALLNFVVIFSEIPTGFIADKFGVYKSIIIGTLLKALATVFYITIFNGSLIIATCLAAIGVAFLSGSINAATYKLKEDNKTDVIFSTVSFYRSTSLILGGVIGYSLFQWNTNYPWIFSGINLIVASLFVFSLSKNETKNIEEYKDLINLKNIPNIIKAQVRKPIFWACVVISVTAVSPLLMWQIFFDKFNFGIILGYITLQTASSSASFSSKKIEYKLKHKYAIMLLNVILIFSIPFCVENLYVLSFVLFSHVFCHVLTNIFVFSRLHDVIEDSSRNTIESLASATDSLLLIPIFLLTGFLIDHGYMIQAFSISSSLGVVVFLLFTFSQSVDSKKTQK